MHRACAPKLLEPHPTASLQPLLALRPCAPFLFSSLLPSQRAELQTAAVRLELCQIFTNKIFHFTRTNTFLAFPKKKTAREPNMYFPLCFSNHRLAGPAASRVSHSNIHLDGENKGSKIWTPESRSNILLYQQRPQPGIAQKPHTSIVRNTIFRNNIVTQHRPQHGLPQQHPFRCRK